MIYYKVGLMKQNQVHLDVAWTRRIGISDRYANASIKPEIDAA